MKKKLLVFAALMLLALACASVAFAKDVPDRANVTRGELGDITSIAGNEVIDYQVEWYETCTVAGRAIFTCQLPEDTCTYYIYIKPHGHTMSSENDPEWGRVYEQPTCSTKGHAVDTCVCDLCDCDYEDWNHIRDIDTKPHEYDDDHIVKPYYLAPSCDHTGLGQHACIYCGQPKPEEKEEDMVVLDKIPHDWKFEIVDPSTCLTYGAIKRSCERCSYYQIIDEDHPVYDQGVEYTIGDLLPLKNPLWNTDLDGEEYDEQQKLEKALADEGFEYELKKNWLKDCYTRELTYTCPYCKGTEHDDFTVSLIYPATKAHIFEAAPDGDDDGNHSVAPTCTEKGFYLYLCKYDADHGHDEDDQWYKEDRDALGHDWSDWFPADIIKDEVSGEYYLVSFRICSRCDASEQKTEKYEQPEVKQGLVKDDDGVWRYYIDGEVATDVTKLIPFQGAEFWVVNGVVPADANGLVICPDGRAWFLAYGMVQKVTDWAEYNGEWFIIKNGQLDKVTGLMPYNGGWFAVESGRKLHVDGLWQDPNTGVWVYMIDGMLWDYTGPAEYDGHTFNVVHGYLAD